MVSFDASPKSLAFGDLSVSARGAHAIVNDRTSVNRTASDSLPNQIPPERIIELLVKGFWHLRRIVKLGLRADPCRASGSQPITRVNLEHRGRMSTSPKHMRGDN